jgi:hypothetical protein
LWRSTLEEIVDEFAIMRLAAPAGVVKQQLRHLVAVVRGGEPSVVLRVLPAQAVTSDVILTGEAQVAPYERMYERLCEAALSPEESAKLLTEAADALPDN